MNTRITSLARPDIVSIESAPRPTPTPARVSFGQVLAAGVSSLVQGAELAASRLPGSPITATAVRGGMTTQSAPLVAVGGAAVSATPEGPLGVATSGLGVTSPPVALGNVSAGASAAATSATDPAGLDASIQQSAQMNLYFLAIQEQVDAQNRSFTAFSNVLKAEHDTAKSAIGNIHS